MKKNKKQTPNFDRMEVESDSILWFGVTAEEIEKKEAVKKKKKDLLKYEDVRDIFKPAEKPKKLKVITLALSGQMYNDLVEAAEYFDQTKQEFIREMLKYDLQDFKDECK